MKQKTSKKPSLVIALMPTKMGMKHKPEMETEEMATKPMKKPSKGGGKKGGGKKGGGRGC